MLLTYVPNVEQKVLHKPKKSQKFSFKVFNTQINLRLDLVSPFRSLFVFLELLVPLEDSRSLSRSERDLATLFS